MGAPSTILLSAIRFHADCQSRVHLDEETVAEYALRMGEGAIFPPVVVFFDGSDRWLADGFHRYAAMKGLARERGDEATTEVAAEVRQGTRTDAIRHALAANAQHGKRREPGDYRKGYDIAVRVGLCEAADVAAVRALLACSERWARDLTADARAKAEAARAAEVERLRREGQSNREIARQTGIPRQTVDRIGAGSKRQTAELSHPRYTPPPEVPAAGTTPIAPPRTIRDALAEVRRPEVEVWSDFIYAMEQALSAVQRAAPHFCTAPAVPRAALLRQRMIEALNNLTIKADTDEAA